MKYVLQGLEPATHIPHSMHGSNRNWPETNCYVDLWIELLSALGLPPEAMLGFTVRQDFEGDQFTFFKVPLEDLERLFDIRVTEFSIFDDVERHVLAQINRGRMLLIEINSYWLPDTRGISYRTSHGKTTIGINAIDPANKLLHYFHNGSFFDLQGSDYDGIFGRTNVVAGAVQLFPYVEFVKFPQIKRNPSPFDCKDFLKYHLAHRPHLNPFLEWQKALPAHIEDLMLRPEGYFHTYAFNTLRQFGANFELLATHLSWLQNSHGTSLDSEIAAAQSISETAKSMQFQLARAISRRKPDSLTGLIAPIAEHYERLMEGLDAFAGVKRAA